MFSKCYNRNQIKKRKKGRIKRKKWKKIKAKTNECVNIIIHIIVACKIKIKCGDKAMSLL